LQDGPHLISETLVWATAAGGDISVACSVDKGTFSNADLEALLSHDELNKACSLTDPLELRHFLFRRGFQRVFLKAFLKFAGQPQHLELLHQQDRPTVCLNAPGCKLTFSSSAGASLAAASANFEVGVDIERIRPIENVVALARRFFTEVEASLIEALPTHRQNIAFLKHWTAKEAGLKAMGRGIVSGLNTFVIAEDGRISSTQQVENLRPWALDYVDLLPNHIVTIVHRLVE
jgi:4'-phosphopantetheinyl transferase